VGAKRADQDQVLTHEARQARQANGRQHHHSKERRPSPAPVPESAQVLDGVRAAPALEKADDEKEAGRDHAVVNIKSTAPTMAIFDPVMMPSVMKPICATDEYAMSRFKSGVAQAINEPYKIPITAKVNTTGRTSANAKGKSPTPKAQQSVRAEFGEQRREFDRAARGRFGVGDR